MSIQRINSEIMDLLQTKLGVTRMSIYYKIKAKREELGYLYSRNIAAIVLAIENGIDVYPHISDEEKQEVKEALGSGPIIVKEVTRAVERVPPRVTFPDKFDIECPNLPQSVFQDAKRMTKVYPYFYVFENSVRYFIIETLESKYGDNWWDTKVSEGVKKNVRKRIKKEEKHKWHGKRGQHPIFYTDISDLSSIVNVNWDDFKDMLPNQNWFNQRINEIEQSRNTVAHNNPLEKDDFNRVKMYFRDWIKQISP